MHWVRLKKLYLPSFQEKIYLFSVDREHQPFNRTPKKKKSLNWLRITGVALAALICAIGLHQMMKWNEAQSAAKLTAKIEIGHFPYVAPTYRYGMMMDTFQLIHQDTILENQFLSDLLLPHQVDYLTIEALANNAKPVFDIRGLRAGKPFLVLNRDTSTAADYFIYEPSVYSYIVFNLKDQSVKQVERPIESKVETASGVIETSLWNTMVDNGLSYELTAKMEDALAWSIDFHHIQKNDQFKLVYERHYIDGKPVGIGEIHGAYFKNFDNEYYAIYYENERHKGFYDLEARPMKKAFLKSPVKYSRISSRYNLRRFHPILKRRRPHYGTDYAAPRGTPIYAVADGVVLKASRTRGNGNYVKIRHDNVYQTQYLHMQRFAKGIRSGVHVKQGQTIGYVGSTGLATGPHVCFRFWKNGKQVNHLRENLPPPEPMPAEDIPRFNEIRDSLKIQLDQIQYRQKKSQVTVAHEEQQEGSERQSDP